MAALDRHRVSWTGFIGQPGVSTFYCVSGTAMNAALHTFYDTIKALLPTDVRINFAAEGDTIESTTGELTGTWTDVASAQISGTDGSAYSAVSGILVQWLTATFLSGRRLRGHTFMVPVGAASYDTSGQIVNGALVLIRPAAQALATAMAGNFVIWQKPRAAAAAYTDRRGLVHPAITSRGGGYGPVATGTARSAVTELRSRRD